MTTRRIAETSPLFRARVAGFLYLLIIVGGLFAPFAVAPSGMMLGDASLPAPAKIMASRSLYALGGASQLMVYACDVGVALLFYELLKPVDRSVALLAAFFRLIFVAVASANIINHFAPLVLLSGADYLGAFNPGQLQALALAFIRFRTFGFDIALVFFGLHCLILGYLLFRSTFFPRILRGCSINWRVGLSRQYFCDGNSTCDCRPHLSLHNVAGRHRRNRIDSVAHHPGRERPEMEGTGKHIATPRKGMISIPTRSQINRSLQFGLCCITEFPENGF
jgi:Domain of unknown function (DUF4386)